MGRTLFREAKRRAVREAQRLEADLQLLIPRQQRVAFGYSGAVGDLYEDGGAVGFGATASIEAICAVPSVVLWGTIYTIDHEADPDKVLEY